MNGHSHLIISATFPMLKCLNITLQVSLSQSKGLWDIWSLLRSKSLLPLTIADVFIFPFFSSPLKFYSTDFEVGVDTVPDRGVQNGDIKKFPALFPILFPTICNFLLAY